MKSAVAVTRAALPPGYTHSQHPQQLARAFDRQRCMRLLDPKNDVVFKLLFGAPRHERVLIQFLTDVLKPSAPIRSAAVLNPEIPRELPGDKSIVLDVQVALADGRFINVEMQCRANPAMRERLLYYWARSYGAQLGTGEDYRKLSPCVGIYVLDFGELQGQGFHSVFGLFNPKTGERLSYALEMHFLELPKIGRHSAGDALFDWGRFFCFRTEEELEALAMSSPSMKEASEALWWVSQDPNSRQMAEMRERSRVAFGHTVAAAREEGLAQGLTEGQLEGMRREIRSLAKVLGIALDAEREERITKLPAEQLERIVHSLVERRCWP